MRARPLAEWTESPRGVLEPEEASAQILSTPKKWEEWSALSQIHSATPTLPFFEIDKDIFLIFGK